MDLSDDLPPPRRPLFFPVVIATTFLSIIGMSVGLLLGNQRDSLSSRAPVNSSVSANPTPEQVETTSPPSGPPCRDETQFAAERSGVTGTLTRVLRMRTKSSEVYICSDPAGDLYYHANNGGDTWEEGRTALFLTGVSAADDGYHVTATDGTEFVVNADQLLIVHKDGREEVQKAVR